MENVRVLTDVEADELINEIRDITEDINRLENIANERIERIKADLKTKVESLNNLIEFDKSQLRAYLQTKDMKVSKTQSSYKLLSGNLVIKKPYVKIEHDDKKILQWAKRENAFIKTEEKLDWSAMKDNLIIDGNDIVDKRTGEALTDIEGLSLQEVAEVFEVKF